MARGVMGRRILCIMATCCFAALSSAYAQDVRFLHDDFEAKSENTGTTWVNPYRHKETYGRVSDMYSPLNSGLETEAFGIHNQNGFSEGMVENPNQWCGVDKNGIPRACVLQEGKTEESYFEPGVRENDVVAFDPMAGFHDTMHSKMYGDLIEQVTLSPVAIQSTVKASTESSVHSGISTAALLGNQFLTNRFASDAAYIKRAELNPLTKDTVLAAYNSCIADWMSGRGLQKEGDSRLWIEAHSRCMGGARISFPSDSENKFGRKDRSKYSALTNDRQSFDHIYPEIQATKLQDNPAHKEKSENPEGAPAYIVEQLQAVINADNSGGRGITLNAKDVLTVVDWMFNEEGRAEKVYNSLGHEGGGGNARVTRYMQKAWRKMFGDYAFALINDPQDPSLGASRKLYSKRILPAGQDGRYRAGSDWYKRALTRQVYYDLNALVYNYCKWKENLREKSKTAATAAGALGIVSGMGGIFGPAAIAAGVAGTAITNANGNPYAYQGIDREEANNPYHFWNHSEFILGVATGRETHPSRLSMRGFMIQPQLGDALYKLYESDTDPNGSALFTCVPLDPQGAESPANPEFLMRRADYVNDLHIVRNNVRKWTRAFWFMSERIATGQYLMTLKRAETAAKSTSSGSFDSLLRGAALNMIYEAAGTNEIDELYIQNLNALNKWIEAMFVKRGNEIARNPDESAGRGGQGGNTTQTDAIGGN